MKLKKNNIKSKKSSAKDPKHIPETPEDFMEFGASEEESGDKFYGSDPAKALRFYQRAYNAYMQAQIPETYYNASRLLFQVHGRYHDEAVVIHDLTGVEEVFSAAMPVVQDLGAIAAAHEKAIEIHTEIGPDLVPSDLFFNAAMVYTELLEAGEAPVAATAKRASELLTKVLEFQISCLFSGEDVRGDIIETARSMYVLASAAVEAAVEATDVSQYAYLSEAESAACRADHNTPAGVHLMLDPEISYVYQSLSEINGGDLDWHDLHIAKTYYETITYPLVEDLEEMFELWTSINVPETPERYMQAADSIESYLFQWGIAPKPGCGVGVVDSAEKVELYWRALTEMTKYLKCAEAGLRSRLDSARQNVQALGVGQIIAQLARVYIARADIDLQRCRLPRELSEANQAVLLKNCSAFLKNAMNLARGSGGIRETYVERTSRARRQVEAIYRLCLLEKKTSEKELDEILGRGKWHEESKSLSQMWYWSTG